MRRDMVLWIAASVCLFAINPQDRGASAIWLVRMANEMRWTIYVRLRGSGDSLHLTISARVPLMSYGRLYRRSRDSWLVRQMSIRKTAFRRHSSEHRDSKERYGKLGPSRAETLLETSGDASYSIFRSHPALAYSI